MLLSLQWFLPVLLLYLSPQSVEAQFPRPCTTPDALQNRTCCPLWNGSPCGNSSGRGFCASYHGDGPSNSVEQREKWPHVFYDSWCKCWGNYDGFDCGQCLPGWKGPECKQRHHVDRKEITDLTDEERETFLSSLQQAKYNVSSRYMMFTSNDTRVEGNYEFHNATVYDLYAWMHYYAAKKYPNSEADSAHKGPVFPFWHRVFLLFIEREIRDLTGNQDFYIPYWNWTRTDHCNICTNKYFGGVGPDGRIDSASPFSKWKVVCPCKEDYSIMCFSSNNDTSDYLIRNPGKDSRYNTLPTAEDVEHTLASQQYDSSPYDKTSKNSFRSKLEGFDTPKDYRDLISSMHNLVHDFFNGTMSHLPTSANDPIFMVHHSFVDKIFEMWSQDHRNATYPDSDEVQKAQRAKANMAPFLPLRTNDYYWDKDILSLGYSYMEYSLLHTEAVTSLKQVAGFLEESTTSGVQWQWPVLGVFVAVLVFISLGAVIKYKDKIWRRQNTWTEVNQSEDQLSALCLDEREN